MKNDRAAAKASGAQARPWDIVDRTFKFAVRLVKLCNYLEQRGGTGKILGPQILRAGTSIGSNVEEAQAGESRADFISKLAVALKEARETHFRLRVLAAAQVVPASRLSALIAEADEIKRVLGSIIVSTKRAR
jgi:four helix bundle protein